MNIKNNKTKKCIFIKPDGKACNAWAMIDSDFCFTHDPKTKKLKKLAVINGGKGNKKNRHSLEAIEVKNTKDVPGLIIKTINEVRQGLTDVRIANCIFYGSGQLIKAFEIADLEERVSKIEELFSEQSTKKY